MQISDEYEFFFQWNSMIYQWLFLEKVWPHSEVSDKKTGRQHCFFLEKFVSQDYNRFPPHSMYLHTDCGMM